MNSYDVALVVSIVWATAVAGVYIKTYLTLKKLTDRDDKF